MRKSESNQILTKAWIRIIIIFLGLLILIWGVGQLRSHRKTQIKNDVVEQKKEFNKISDEELYSKLKNVVMTVPDTQTVIQLKNGESDYKIDPEIESLGSISLSTPYEIKQIEPTAKTDGRTDIITPITVESGGSGSFQYIELFSWNGEKLLEKSYAFLGDRISIDDITTTAGSGNTDYKVVVTYLTRNDDEPMSDEPTHKKQTTIPVVEGRFDARNTKTISL